MEGETLPQAALQLMELSILDMSHQAGVVVARGRSQHDSLGLNHALVSSGTWKTFFSFVVHKRFFIFLTIL